MIVRIDRDRSDAKGKSVKRVVMGYGNSRYMRMCRYVGTIVYIIKIKIHNKIILVPRRMRVGKTVWKYRVGTFRGKTIRLIANS